ncbi:hypothetical protein Pmani_010603 [Petrolisthes manimaculis]|uniref:Uncharacterized protein n=1 Tax=Petrolisthes manimaculis TaxID=1843537 RepID=A0AAE1UBU5_9EUCA|nr:hypothetical protein Pmani_010603 [Petrolisthes manimaculis]
MRSDESEVCIEGEDERGWRNESGSKFGTGKGQGEVEGGKEAGGGGERERGRGRWREGKRQGEVERGKDGGGGGGRERWRWRRGEGGEEEGKKRGREEHRQRKGGKEKAVNILRFMTMGKGKRKMKKRSRLSVVERVDSPSVFWRWGVPRPLAPRR